MSATQHPYSPLTVTQQATLMGALNQQRVSSRKQGGRSLSYLEAYDVKATLIRVFGFGGFSAEADECEVVQIEDNIEKTTGYGQNKNTVPIEYHQNGSIKRSTANYRVTVRVRVTLTIHQLGATFTEWAAASQTGPDLGDVTDFAIKTAESDALKRAAIYLGTQFGLSLYNNGSTSDVVKVVMAPGQEWYMGSPVNRNITDADRSVGQQANEAPMPEAQSVAEEPQQAQQQPQQAQQGQAQAQPAQAPQQGAQPVSPESAQQGIPQDGQPYPNVTQEQHDANKALVERALQAKEMQQPPAQQ